MCDRGKSCCNDHTFYTDDEAIARIPCGLPCRLRGACKLGTACVHSQEEQPKPSPAESLGFFPMYDLPEGEQYSCAAGMNHAFLRFLRKKLVVILGIFHEFFDFISSYLRLMLVSCSPAAVVGVVARQRVWKWRKVCRSHPVAMILLTRNHLG